MVKIFSLCLYNGKEFQGGMGTFLKVCTSDLQSTFLGMQASAKARIGKKDFAGTEQKLHLVTNHISARRLEVRYSILALLPV